MTNEILHSILDLRTKRELGALCTIVKTEGSTPLKAGAQMLVRANAAIVGTIGGGALEYSVIEQARAAMSSNESRLVQHRLTHDHKMCCGGTVHLYIEVIEVPAQCFIFGAGHVGRALATLCSSLDFEVVVIDERPEIFDGWRDSDPHRNQQIRFVPKEAAGVLPSLTWDSNTYIVIATHSHPLDREILRLVLQQQFKYCGMIGSRRKVLVIRELFVEQGWATNDELDDIDMPIGIDISASSPAEIAVSIAAKMIEVKNRKTARTFNVPAGVTTFQLSTEYTHDLASASATL